jgi:hypothetical protein
MSRRLLLVLTLLATVCSLEAQRVVISEIHFDRAEFLESYTPGETDADPLTITPVYYPVSDNPNNSGKFAWYEASFHRHRNPWTPLPTLFNPSKKFEPTIEVIDGQREKFTCRIYRNRKPKFTRLRALTSP